MQFRKDINGLRAFAVIAVVLYHFGAPGATGGFIGVDVFFVISGYLMTGIILTKLDSERFSLTDFYLARARRIIPALAVVCLALAAYGWFRLVPSEYLRLGEQIATAMLFVSNFLFWTEAGYFDVASHEKWLLHTWSLSVEWQFYLLYPIAILLLNRLLTRSYLKALIFLAALASFGLSVYASSRWPGAAFYLLPTRAWEMLAGALVFMYPLSISKRFIAPVEMVGLVTLVVAILAIDTQAVWPGSLAVIPVLATVLVLYAGRNHSVWTGNTVAQFLGNASYSIYLWHWPICVALTKAGLATNFVWMFFGIAGSLLAGLWSYRYVEESARHQRWAIRVGIKPVYRYSVTVMVVGLVGFALVLSQGAPTTARMDEKVLFADSATNDRNPRAKECNVRSGMKESPRCIFGTETNNVSVIVVGDSHANATINAVAEAIPEGGGGALHLGADGCMSLINISTKFFPDCGGYNREVLKFLSENYAGIPVVIINRTSAPLLGVDERKDQGRTSISGILKGDREYQRIFREQYIDGVCSIAASHPVFIVTPIPEMDVDVPKTMVSQYLNGTSEDVLQTVTAYGSRNGPALEIILETAKKCGAKLLDPVPFLCEEGRCLAIREGRALYYDSNHLNEHGNRYLTPMFAQIWRKERLAVAQDVRVRR